MNEPELTASLLLRLSSPDEEERTGFETQERDLNALAARLNARVVAVRKDDGWSGILRQRPGFRAWLGDGEHGRELPTPYKGKPVDFLLSWKSDRISRGGIASVAPLVDLANGVNPETGLPSHGHRPRVMTAVDGVDSSQPRWEMSFSVHSETAKGERDATSLRMLGHRAANRLTGRAVGGRRPWAFDTVPNPDGPGSVRRPIPAHAAAIRWAYEHLDKGGSKTAIVREWNARGLAPKGSNKARKAGKKTGWHVTPVTRILRNPNLYGAVTHLGGLLRNEDGTLRIDKGQAVLTYAEWVYLQVLLDGRSIERDQPDRNDLTLLAGILLCGSCTRIMYPHRPQGRVWTYRCRGGSGCESPTSIHMGMVEAFLVDEFHRLLGDAHPNPQSWEPDVVTVDPEEVASLLEAIAAANLLLDGDLRDEDALAELKKRRDLRARLAALQDDAAASEAPAKGLREVPAGQTFSGAYNAADTMQEKTRLLALAFGRVTVAPGGTRGVFDPSRLTW